MTEGRRPRAAILVLNPGSTSTKMAWFDGTRKVWETELDHPARELARFKGVFGQLDWRCGLVERELRMRKADLKDLAAVAGRGGLMKPVQGGTYRVNAAMLKDLRASKKRWGLEHASSLGAAMAARFSAYAYVVDPVTTDELVPEARVSGLPGFERTSLLHALNTKAVCRWACGTLGRRLKGSRFVVAHLGGGASVSAVDGGRIVDTSGAIAGQGPFTANRAGSLPSKAVLDLVAGGRRPEAALKVILKESGLKGYLGNEDLRRARIRARRGDAKARLVLKALVHQVSKEVAAYASVLEGRLDGVLLTGGMAHDEGLARDLKRRVGFLGRFLVYPGQREMEALAEGVWRVLSGMERERTYR